MKLTDLTTGSTPFVFDLQSDSANFVDITFNNDNTIMTVKMVGSVTTAAEGYRNFVRLAAGHKYQVELVSTQAKDTSGNLLYYTGNEAIFTFTTADVSTTQNIVVPVQSPSSVPGINISIPKGIGIVIPMDLWTEVSIQVVDQSTSEDVYSDKVVYMA